MRGSGLGEPNARLITVCELDAGGLKGTANRKLVRRGQRGYSVLCLSTFDGVEAQGCLARKTFYAPSQKRSSGPNLTS
jgi:hypothetical protein